MAATDALPIPRKGAAYRVVFPGFKNDGTLNTSGTGMDSERSLDMGTFADCTNEATEIATNSGIYYLDLTAAEMNFDSVTVKITWTNTGALTQVLTLYPEETGDIRVNVTQMAAGVIAAATFAANALDAVWSATTRTLTSFGTLVADTAAAVWNYATASAGAVSTFGGYILSKLGLISSGSITVTAPVLASGDVEIVRGDDYLNADGRALEWSSDDWTPLDLTSAQSVTFKANTRYMTTVFSKAATVLSDTEVRVELTHAETTLFAVGRNAYRFDLEAVLVSGDIITLAQGTMTVLEDVR